MLRNCVSSTILQRGDAKKAQLLLVHLLGRAYMSTGVQLAKNSTTNSQAKIFGKLFGDRVAGSKKRRFPTHETHAQPVDFINATNLGKSGRKQGKNTTRRMTVLNKLFMKHITDLLATSSLCQAVQGRGLQVTHVKISPDFAFVNVFWMGSGASAADMELEKQLQRCSGLLRHELSQLSLMGQVPRINFVRDRTLSNSSEIDALLRGMDFGEDYKCADLAEEVRRDFNWRPSEPDTGKEKGALDDSTKVEVVLKVNTDITPLLPTMRHDVLGLDHRNIMFKILNKMRKSKLAWEMHDQGHGLVSRKDASKDRGSGLLNLQRDNKKLVDAAAVENKFEKFLASRKERKNTPERKKFRQSDQMLERTTADAMLEEFALQIQTNDDRDYINDDENENT